MSEIISRTRWGAQYRNGVGTRPVGRLEKYLHHAVVPTPSANASFAEDAAAVRTIERIGQSRFGAGISYTFLVAPSGRIFQGAGVGRVSYHSGGSRNTRGAGICLVGNFQTDSVTGEMLDSIVWLLQEGVRRDWWGDPALTAPHREFKATSCPGDYAIEHFDELNRRGRGKTVTESGASSGGSGSSSSGTRTPVAPSQGRWPEAYLTVRDHHNEYSHRAWRDLMHRIGIEKSSFTLEAQTWLQQWPKYDVGPADDDWGARTTKALQRFLRDRGHYAGWIDGRREKLTVRGEFEYLNDQAELIVNL